MDPDREYKPGETVEDSGIYDQFDSEDILQEPVTCSAGEPFPPTNSTGGYFKLRQATKGE